MTTSRSSHWETVLSSFEPPAPRGVPPPAPLPALLPPPPALPEIVYTDDESSVLGQFVQRKCHSCGERKTTAWRRSLSVPGKMLCNRCGLAERHGPGNLAVPLVKRVQPQVKHHAYPGDGRKCCSASNERESVVCSQCKPWEPTKAPGSEAGPSNVVVTYTSDELTTVTALTRRECFNCSEVQTSAWRRSRLNAGKMLCNKCGLFERQYMRPRVVPSSPSPASTLCSSSATPMYTHPPPARRPEFELEKSDHAGGDNQHRLNRETTPNRRVRDSSHPYMGEFRRGRESMSPRVGELNLEGGHP